MNPKERDDVIYAINQTQAFYGKSLDDLQLKFWMRAIGMYSRDEILKALADHTGIGKYAPKPVEIIDLIKTQREQARSHAPRVEKTATREASPEVAKAWQYVIKAWGLGNLYKIEGVSDDQAARYLEIANTQAMNSNRPTAIPEDAWLPEVWGCTRDSAIARLS
jgi:hypothetical protein